MSNDLISSGNPAIPKTMGDRIRGLAAQLQQETNLQIKATSRILGAAAQIAQNHDRLIDEVVEMVEADLEPPQISEPVTIEQLKQRFKTLNQAKTHFGIKVSSWAGLVNKLNEPVEPSSFDQDAAVSQRLEAIEHELKAVRTDLNQALNLLTLILEKVS